MARRDLAVLGLALLLCLAPQAGKAFHVDDPLFLRTAHQITAHPLDPYGFTVNWDVTEQPMAEITKNPPLSAYYLALAGSVLGWSELPLHLAFLVPAAAAIFGTYVLATRLCRSVLVAGLATLLTPGFLISASSVMCDVTMLTFWVWAVVLWVDGLERHSTWRLLGAATLVTAAALTKYFGASLVALLLAYGLARRRRLGAWALPLLVPVAALAAYQAWTWELYGRGLFSDAATFVVGWQQGVGEPLVNRLLAGLAFAGGCAVAAPLLAPLRWPRGGWIAAGCTFATLALVGSAVLRPAATTTPALSFGLQFGALAMGAMVLLALVVSDARRRRDAGSVLLGLWLLGTLAFAGIVNWTVNARSVLPLLPAAAILAARRLDDLGALRPLSGRIGVAAALGVASLVSVAVAGADLRLANAQRTAASRILDRPGDARPRVWFEGHWGFQYYMEAMGATAVDLRRPRARAGDLVVLPGNNSSVGEVPANFIARVQDVEIDTGAWCTTMSREAGAGFYSSGYGPLPFSLGKAPPERYRIVTLAR